MLLQSNKITEVKSRKIFNNDHCAKISQYCNTNRFAKINPHKNLFSQYLFYTKKVSDFQMQYFVKYIHKHELVYSIQNKKYQNIKIYYMQKILLHDKETRKT